MRNSSPSLLYLVLASFLFSACSKKEEFQAVTNDLTVKGHGVYTLGDPSSLVTESRGGIEIKDKRIHMGEARLLTKTTAVFELVNNATGDLVLGDIRWKDEPKGSAWGTPLLKDAVGGSPRAGNRMPPRSKNYLEVELAASDILPAEGELELLRASDGKLLDTVSLKATPRYFGTPRIQVRYKFNDEASIQGPLYNPFKDPITQEDTVAIDSDWANGRCTDGICTLPILDMGTSVSSTVFVHNEAQCYVAPSAVPCESCALRLEDDPSNDTLTGALGVPVGSNALGFAPGTNDEGYFSIVGDLSGGINQSEGACTSFGEFEVVFNGPADQVQGDWSTVLVMETNDAQAPVVMFQVNASKRVGPVAIAGLKERDSASDQYFSEADDIEPLDYVYLDGRAKGSTSSTHDPRDPSNTGLITNYQWRVISAPTGVNPQTMDLQQFQTPGLARLIAPVPGEYAIGLTVYNELGQFSSDTQESRILFDAVSREDIRVEALWNNGEDLDLHMTRNRGPLCDSEPGVLPGLFVREGDAINFVQRQPVWFSSFGRASGPNGFLDIDDIQLNPPGFGPETILIDNANAGTYQVYVHWFGTQVPAGTDPATYYATRQPEVTVNVYVDGALAGSYNRTLTGFNEETWAVGEFTSSGGVNDWTPFTGAGGEIGYSANKPRGCSGTGWAFPFP